MFYSAWTKDITKNLTLSNRYLITDFYFKLKILLPTLNHGDSEKKKKQLLKPAVF